MHSDKHPEYDPQCFACKLQSVTFGIVPGGYRDMNSTSMYDREALKQQFTGKDGEPVFNKERVEDSRSTFKRKMREVLDA